MVKNEIRKESVTFVRDSGIELLRLVAMFMVLLLHADFFIFGVPSSNEIISYPISSIGRTYIEFLCIVAVNIFIVISGWFGIRQCLKSFFSLVLQVVTYSFVLFLFACIADRENFSAKWFLDFLIVGKPYWFIISYLLLYLISPVLNTFIEEAPKKTISRVLVVFFLFEFIYGWAFHLEGFNYGYSTISFAGLYVLSRYLRIYGHQIMLYKKHHFLFVYLLLTLLSTLWTLFQCYFLGGVIWGISYDCPLVVIASVSLFLFFTKIRIRSQLINYLSSSALSVYLIHTNPHIFGYFRVLIIDLNNYGGHYIGPILVVVALFVIFFLCIIIDKIRLYITPTIIINKISDFHLNRFI